MLACSKHQALITEHGTNSDSILYRNFQA